VPDGYYQREKNYNEIISSLLMNENGVSVFVKGLFMTLLYHIYIFFTRLFVVIPHTRFQAYCIVRLIGGFRSHDQPPHWPIHRAPASS
jgi:hypothetical protein